MPMMQCEVHGSTTYLAHVCSHIDDDVRASRPVRHFNTYYISMEGVPDLLYFTIMSFCDDCVQSRNLPSPGVIPEEKWDYDNRKWATHLICKACWKQYSQQEVPDKNFGV